MVSQIGGGGQPNRQNPPPYTSSFAPPTRDRRGNSQLLISTREDRRIAPFDNTFIDFLREILFGTRDIRRVNVFGVLFIIAVSTVLFHILRALSGSYINCFHNHNFLVADEGFWF
jgi:hypothetical protein